jgi:uncharacterized protein (TIGR03000 family)
VIYHAPISESAPIVYAPPIPGYAPVPDQGPVIVSTATSSEEEQEDPEAQPYPQTEADQRLLRDLMERIPDAEARKMVLTYWLSSGVDSRSREEFYRELIRKTTGENQEQEESKATSCTMVVHLPPNARVTFGREEVPPRKVTRRTFVTPPLEPGKWFRYQVVAEFERAGETVQITRQVKVWAGATVEVHLDEDE